MFYDVLVIGAGQAGLAMGYYLKQTKLSFLILDKESAIGESWKKRYDSLTLFTPRSYSSLPGLTLNGEEKIYPTKDEITDYLSLYANTFSLPIQLDTTVKRVDKEDHFLLHTTKGVYHCRNVIIATGPFQKPFIPEFSHYLSENILQVHSSKYKNPSQINEGTTLVVGGGNSGAQIAVELSHSKEVYLSVGHQMRFLPQDIGSKSIFWWFDKLGVYRANVHSKVGQYIKNKPDPIFGFELKTQLKNRSVILKPRVTSADNSQVFFNDGSSIEVSNVIWSTGFKSDFSFIHISSVLNEKGLPIHQRGVTKVKGLFFLGLAWQNSRGSALLQGVGTDAKYIVEKLI
ncbi:NAD(P)/FAD-dependent oxidoreductase [Neobacillus sp. 179-C4.2 HS]|uniref:NAD(P)/FAD-dependent oxidoreductase n=1 Tax=Neobacillus driksii TaxID=3035913 RepID=A0ABV4YS38_9BACI|nr:NAD(P)/FAD-dependent oxidoreductase [Neobacillus sp. 179.-C4.2 HS]MDP5194212.1 NAD(P)/FAD-dependent oxidoreductase [Neobacillus sp. 179.-C4.2 HS]